MLMTCLHLQKHRRLEELPLSSLAETSYRRSSNKPTPALTPLTLVLYCPQEASSRNLVTLRVDPSGFFLYWTGPNMVRAVLVLLAQA